MMMLEAALLSQRAIKGRSVKKKLDEFRIKEMWRAQNRMKQSGKGSVCTGNKAHTGFIWFVYFTSSEGNNLFRLVIKPPEQSKMLIPCMREIKYELKFSFPSWCLRQAKGCCLCSFSSYPAREGKFHFLRTIFSYSFSVKAPEAIIYFILLTFLRRQSAFSMSLYEISSARAHSR